MDSFGVKLKQIFIFEWLKIKANPLNSLRTKDGKIFWN
jgi:hypothetical protein